MIFMCWNAPDIDPNRNHSQLLHSKLNIPGGGL
jgi:hypothetical protein